MIQRPFLQLFARTSLVLQIFIGLVAGILLALLFPQAGSQVGLFGELFIRALKAVAPVLGARPSTWPARQSPSAS